MTFKRNSINISSEEDSLNDFPSPEEYIDASKKDWKIPTYNNLSNDSEIKKQIPPLIEEIDFSKCKLNHALKLSKRKSNKKGVQTVDRKNSLSQSNSAFKNPSKLSKSALISNDSNANKMPIESNSNLREGNFLNDIDSDNNQSDSYYSKYDDDYSDGPNNTVINLPPPLEIGKEMPSIPEIDIFEMFEFQLPLMPDPSENDTKYIQEIDLRFDKEKLLNEVKAH